MTEPVVRRLLVDLEAPIAVHWCDGDPFRTALFNALSMSFPVGEQFFIDSVRDGSKVLPPERQQSFASEIRGFVGQEATHRRLHGLFNGHLERQGLVNGWGARAAHRLKRMEGKDPRHSVAITAAYEHFTAIMADWMLKNADFLAGSDERLQTLWLWHAAEECEHKTVAFDLYHDMGGDEAWRLRWFNRITLLFLTDALRQTVDNLHRTGTLWRWSTWESAGRHLLGRRGLVRETFASWRAYRRADFHPLQQDSTRSTDWLASNRERYTPIGANSGATMPATAA